jgi:FkbM family methyltransferase
MKKLYPEAVVLAFEPDEKNFDLLSKNIVSFGYKDITLRKEAVWKENTTLKFSNEGATTSKIESKPTTSSKDVKATRLKDFLDREIDFLKIDIEGAEFEVVMDLSENLHHIKNLFIEYHGSFGQNNELLQILNLVCEKGFNFYIKEATPAYQSPFYRLKESKIPYDIQLNIFCFRKDTSNT